MMRTEVSRHSWPATTILLAAIATLPWQVWYFGVQPHREKRLQAIEKELQKVDLRLEQAKSAQRKHAQFLEEATRLRNEREQLSRILPRESPEAPYAGIMKSIAGRYDVTLTSVSPRIAGRNLPYVEHRYDMEATGSLSSLVAFLGEFERQSRIVSMPEIELIREGRSWRASALVVVPYERNLP